MQKKLWHKRALTITMLFVSMNAFADFNPFDVFNSNDSSTTNSTQSNNVSASASNDSNTAPASTTGINTNSTSNPSSAPSPYVQVQPLTAPATAATPAKAKTSSTASTVQINPDAQSLPANRYMAASVATGATIGLPISGSGGQQGATNSNNLQASVPAGSILEALNLINKSVGTINSNLMNWKTTDDKNKISAAAQLVPSTKENIRNFLFNQSGFSNILSILPIRNLLDTDQLRDFGVSSDPTMDTVNLNAGNLLAPVNKAQLQSQLSQGGQAKASTNVMSLSEYKSFSDKYVDSLTGGLASEGGSINPVQAKLLDLVSTAIRQVAAQTKIVGSADESVMSTLQSAVNAPFMKSASKENTWFTQLEAASTQQILRSIAILLATNNQIHYLQLQNSQMALALQAGQLSNNVLLDKHLQQLSDAQQQTNDLLNKILAQMIAQNTKK